MGAGKSVRRLAEVSAGVSIGERMRPRVLASAPSRSRTSPVQRLISLQFETVVPRRRFLRHFTMHDSQRNLGFRRASGRGIFKTMTVQNLPDQASFITKDGSTIRSV